MPTINVIGMGYIGLPTSLMFANAGCNVIGTDSKSETVERLTAGQMTFDEPGLKAVYAQALAAGITFSTTYQKAEIYIIAVPTPYQKDTKQVDISFLTAAVGSVLDVCDDHSLIIVESTVAPGTIDTFIRPMIGAREIQIAHAPERIIPGRMVFELLHNSRVVGADTPEIAEQVKKLYSSFCTGDIVKTSIRTAELSKVAENTFRDVNIAYANELARICYEADLDVYELIRIANMHPRVNILQPGPGVGGHCIPVDPWFLVGNYPETVEVTSAARRVNDGQPAWILKRLRNIMDVQGIKSLSRVGFYGLTYKENVDDTRDSPTLQLLSLLADESADVVTYDPYVPCGLTPRQAESLDEFLESVELVVIMVGHDEIRANLGKLAGKAVFDTRAIVGAESNVVGL